ncbi:glucose 1-dehydrogenase [Flavobacterium sp. LB3P122]|uniref:glucose 1-dehydrogenase n=1 Tax=Flavobacterium algoriphilum TaxID=3398738 RepID=UPI003A8B377B
METTFKNKVAIVTGGSSGIGKATALAFAEKGAKVAVVDWLENNETVNLIKGMGEDAIFIKCDVSKSTDVKAMVAKTISTFGGLDYACNNACSDGMSALTQDSTEENWDKTIGIDLKGIRLCMKYEIPEILKQGKGVIVNCSSGAGLVGHSGLPVDTHSKQDIVGLTKTAALECSKLGIRVNAVCPGVIQTPMIDQLTRTSEEAVEQFTGLKPIDRFGLPEEIANAVIWMCSDEASFVTGLAMAVDGGFIAQ